MLRSPWLLCHFKTLNGLAMYLYNNRNEQLVQQGGVYCQHRQVEELLRAGFRQLPLEDLQGESVQDERWTRRTEDRPARRGTPPSIQHIRTYLKKPSLLFQKCIDMKEGSSRLEEVIKNEIINERYMPELKIEHEDEKDNYLAVQPKSTR